jgi:crotonobetainyl-CoA:carnitine CoA-transferase CaiB-like acyl-CoA transferase
MELFERWPGAKFADHARGNRELQRELREIFKTKTSAEWIRFSDEHNTPIAPVNTPKTIADDPQFQHRLPFYPASRHGAEMLPFPLKLTDETLPEPTMAPTVGEHTDAVLKRVLGYDDERVRKLREGGALG